VRYEVVLTLDAEASIRSIHRYLLAQAPSAAQAWLAGIRMKVRSLERSPGRGSVAPESEVWGATVRQVLYGHGNRGTYRVLYIIVHKTVQVLLVKHGSMLSE
jgi:toxin ParE1/3/4